MEAFETITLRVAGPVARVTLNRPASGNAMSTVMVNELLCCFDALKRDPTYQAVRIIVLTGAGQTFCSGGDLHDLGTLEGEHRALPKRMDELLRTVNETPHVVIARVQGAAFGGGMGLVCVSDIAVAGYSARFGLQEVRLGLVPSIILPYVMQRAGFTHARQLLLTGVEFGYAEAHTYCLIQHYCADNELDARVRAVIQDVLHCAPVALGEAKRLLFKVAGEPDDLSYRVELLNRLRTGEEARQGFAAFQEGKRPPWAPAE